MSRGKSLGALVVAATMSTPELGDVTGGTLQLADDLAVTRMGYGAMQLAGPGVWGPPRDREQAIAVLRRVVELGLTHIDTSDYYGPYTVNEVIREALHPYPDDLVLVTKVGARREPDKSWPAARSRDELIQAVHDNIDHLGVEAIDVVNLRMTGPGRRAGRRLGRRAVRRPGRAPAAGTDPPPRRQQRDRRAGRGGALDRTDRVRAEPLQPRAP